MSQTSLGGCRRGLFHPCHGRPQAPDGPHPEARTAEGGSWERDPRLQAAPLLRDFPARPGVRPRPRMLSRLPARPSLVMQGLGLPGRASQGDGPGSMTRAGSPDQGSAVGGPGRPRSVPRPDPGAEAPRHGRALPREAVNDCRKRTAGSAWLRCPICSTLWPEVVSIAP
jgi:hypothetical protein